MASPSSLFKGDTQYQQQCQPRPKTCSKCRICLLHTANSEHPGDSSADASLSNTHSTFMLSEGLGSLMLPVEEAGTVTGTTPGWVPQLSCPYLLAATHILSHLTGNEMNNAEPHTAVFNITILGALKLQRWIMKQKKLKNDPKTLAALEILLSPKYELTSVSPCHMPAPPCSQAKCKVLETAKCR